MHGRDWVYHQISVALSSWNFNEGRHAFFKRLDYSAYRTDFWKAV